jgi:hypothetical protein
VSDESAAILRGHLERAVAGDAEARGPLLELARDRLLRHALRLLNGQPLHADLGGSHGELCIGWPGVQAGVGRAGTLWSGDRTPSSATPVAMPSPG